MQIATVLAALRKHRLATALIALEIALACAVLCNACFLIASRIEAMNVHSGVDEASLAMLRVEGFDARNATELNARIVQGLRALPGMQSVGVINTVPFGPQTGSAGVTLDAEGQRRGGQVDFYIGGPGSFEAMGLQLVAGRVPQGDDFQPVADFVPNDSRVWISRALADHFWPDADPLGREFWCDKYHFRVVGIVDHLAIAQPGSRGATSREWGVFVPGQPGANLVGTYLLRARPGQLPGLLQQARAAMTHIAPDVVLAQDESRTVTDLRERFFRPARIMSGMLAGVVVALLLVTALGIVGLGSFWVAQRRRQIGIRRAIGATRGDILRYFQLENFLIVTFGIVLGMVLAYGLNVLLMNVYELPRLPPYYLPLGAVALWSLGQLAVLGPALRAAAVPPVVATRS